MVRMPDGHIKIILELICIGACCLDNSAEITTSASRATFNVALWLHLAGTSLHLKTCQVCSREYMNKTLPSQNSYQPILKYLL